MLELSRNVGWVRHVSVHAERAARVSGGHKLNLIATKIFNYRVVTQHHYFDHFDKQKIGIGLIEKRYIVTEDVGLRRNIDLEKS